MTVPRSKKTFYKEGCRKGRKVGREREGEWTGRGKGEKGEREDFYKSLKKIDNPMEIFAKYSINVSLKVT